MAPSVPHRVSHAQAQPGDVLLTKGGGLLGAAIRLGTRSRWGHTGIIEQVLDDGSWVTHEARAKGYTRNLRDADDEEVILWRFPGAGDRIVLISGFMVALGFKYEWGNLVRHAIHSIFRIRIPLKDNPRRMICSEATARVLDEAGVLDLRRPAYEYTPGDLDYEFDLLAAGHDPSTV